MKEIAKYTLILLAITFNILFNACTKPVNISSENIKLPFSFTFFGVIPVNSGIKEINDSLGLQNETYYFNTDGKLYKMIYRYKSFLEIDSINDPALSDSINIILDNVVYNNNNQIVTIGNSIKSDVYKFEYEGNNLKKVSQNYTPLVSSDTGNAIINEFISDNSGNFISSIYKHPRICPVSKIYHYTQSKLDSISVINPICGSTIITGTSVQFFYTNNLITGYEFLTDLINFNKNYSLIYNNGKLTEIKIPNSILQGSPHTTFIYY